ncbi:MAG: hypothetical protein HZA53_11100 [Planctomycetes bacterium]|nr:hypothetical protein [Planctomycetota bacterium]
MADLPDECPTPEQHEARLNDLAQIYDLGLALRDVRFLDAEEERMRLQQLARLSDVGPDSTPEPDSRSEGSRSR